MGDHEVTLKIEYASEADRTQSVHDDIGKKVKLTLFFEAEHLER